jgi:aldehyde:ferredoxin oxidoreductase
MYATFYALEYPLVDKEQAMDPAGLGAKPERLVERENHHAVLDSGVVCKFSRGFVTDERLAELLGASFEELMDVGARVVDLERHFNNRRGFDRDDDRLPYSLPGFDAALDEYYVARGWTADGTVPDARIGGEDDAAPADD